MNEALSQITERITTMTDFMTRDSDPDEQNPIEASVFEEYDKLRTWSDKERLVQHAEDALRHLKQHKTATDDNLRAAAISGRDQVLKEGLWALISPLISSADGVEWTGGFVLDSDAPETQSEEWRNAASTLEIPDTRQYSTVPNAVKTSYRHLEKLTTRNDQPRPASREELVRNCGVHFQTEEYRRYVEGYLVELPGVTGPDDGPAWEYTDQSEADTTGTGEANA